MYIFMLLGLLALGITGCAEMTDEEYRWRAQMLNDSIQRSRDRQAQFNQSLAPRSRCGMVSVEGRLLHVCQ